MNNLQNNQKNNETPMGYDTLLAAVWIDNKGRQVEIHTMSDRWLNNI